VNDFATTRDQRDRANQFAVFDFAFDQLVDSLKPFRRQPDRFRFDRWRSLTVSKRKRANRQQQGAKKLVQMFSHQILS
jgi:hypothetical protein